MSDRFVDTFKNEIAEEKAESLGHTGRRLEHAVEQLREHDRARGATAIRERLLWYLAERVQALIVQREACGLRDSRYVLEFYAVPHEAMARVGAKRPEALS